MLLPSSSRLVRSLFAAASLLLTASPAFAAAPDKDASADTAAKKEAKDAGNKAGSDAKPAAAKSGDAKKDAAKGDKKDAAKGAKADKKDAAKADKTAKKDAAKADEKDAAKADKKDAAKGKVAKKDDAKDAKKDPIKGPASIGAPNKGKLAGAIKLHSSRSLKVRDRANVWGLPDLVKLLQRAAGKVAKRHPRSVMLVGDLSQKSGGSLTGHNSHQSGRDADVGFYIANSKGQPAAMTRFVAFDGAGKSTQVSWAQFDDARNWTLVEALITDTTAPVRYVFVSNPLRARILAYAAKKKVAKDVYSKAEAMLLAPRDADVHDDHFHVRIACPDSMKGTCIEESLGRPPPSRTRTAVAKADPKPTDADTSKSAPTDAKPAAADADPKVAAAPAPADPPKP